MQFTMAEVRDVILEARASNQRPRGVAAQGGSSLSGRVWQTCTREIWTRFFSELHGEVRPPTEELAEGYRAKGYAEKAWTSA